MMMMMMMMMTTTTTTTIMLNHKGLELETSHKWGGSSSWGLEGNLKPGGIKFLSFKTLTKQWGKEFEPSGFKFHSSFPHQTGPKYWG